MANRVDRLEFIVTAAQCVSAECLIWPYAKTGSGYPVIWMDGKNASVHRIVCETAHGPAPSEDHEVAHLCGRGHLGCVNAQHLVWKMRKQNHADKLVHGTAQRGERHNMAKLTQAQVREIRAAPRKKGQNAQFAQRFGVSVAAIEYVRCRRSWAWLQ